VYLKENEISTERFYYIYTMCQHWFFLCLGNGILGIFYYFQFECIEKYKSVEEEWPWKENKKEFIILLKKSIGMLLFNGTVTITVLQIPQLFLGEKHPWSMETDKIPGPFTFACSILFFTMCEDLTFSFSHRLLHTPFLYKHIHKIHHKHKVTIGIAS